MKDTGKVIDNISLSISIRTGTSLEALSECL